MKKHSAMFFTFSALLTLNAFAPQIFWQDHNVSRAPASYEEDRLEALALKKSEEIELLQLVEVQIKEDRKVVEVKVEEQVQCQKDKSSNLEDQIKQLVLDKENILKELEELKDLKKALKESRQKSAAKVSKSKEDKELKEPKEKVEVIDVMSQLSSLMVSQQLQQQMMMEHMFSMMPQQQPRPFSMNNYMPFATQYSDYDTYSYETVHTMGRRVGIGYPGQNSQGFINPYMQHNPYIQSQYDMNRIPSNEPQALQRYNNPSAYIAPEQQQQIPHNGFNFQNGSNIERIQF